MSLMDAVKEKAFQLALYWNSRPNMARRLVRELGAKRSDNLRVIEFDRIRVAAIQVRVQPVSGLGSFMEQMLPLTQEAVDRGAQLLVFPEHLEQGLFGMLPGFSELQAASLGEAVREFGDDVAFEDLLRFVGPAIMRAYRATFSELSRAFGVYIAAGSIMMLTRQGVRNVSHLYDPNGRLLGTTAKTHLLPIERHQLGMGRGCELSVHETRIGKVAAPICMSASFFEPIRILGLMGAEIVALPVADLQDEYNYWPTLRGLWPRVQETPLYGVKACLVGEFMGLKYFGKSAVYAPLELTPEKDGVLASLEEPYQEGLVVTDVDLVALRKYRQESGFYDDLNYDLYRRYLPWLYTQAEPPPEVWLYDREEPPPLRQEWV